MTDAQPRAALYIRVSTDDQTEFSPAAQKKALIDYANKNNMDIHPSHIFVDEGFSGRTADKRPSFMRMIGMAKAKPKPFDVILVHRFDRFARNREDSIVYKSMLKKQYQIRVISITESLDEDDKMSGLIEAILEAMAEYYSINLSEEVKKGMTEKALRGGFQTSPAFGYKMGADKVLRIVEEEADHVRYIFTQFVEFDRGTSQIARQLTNQGVKSKRGNPLDERSVNYILKNPLYIGMVRWTPTGKVKRGTSHPDTIVAHGQHMPIVSEALFQKAAEKLAANEKAPQPNRRPLGECKHWLSGLVKCSNCGSSLTISKAKNCPSFQCRGYSGAICNVSHSISIRKLETAIVEELKQALARCDTSNFYVQPTNPTAPHDEIHALQKQRDKIDRRLQRANEAYLAGVYPLDEYKKIRTSLAQAEQALSASIQIQTAMPPTPTQPITSTGKIQTILDIIVAEVDISVKQKAIRGIIQTIVFDRPNARVDIYYAASGLEPDTVVTP